MDGIDPRLYFLMRKLKGVKDKYFKGAPVRVLDIGYADGSFMKIVKDNLPDVDRIDGVDVPSKWTQNSRKCGDGICYLQDLQIGTGDIPLGNYHVVVAWEVIEHISNVPAFLKNVRKIMDDGGIILLSTPNLLGLSRFVKGGKWVGITETDHKYLFDSLSLGMILERNGFSEVACKGYYFPSVGPAYDRLNEVVGVVPGGGMLFCRALAKN